MCIQMAVREEQGAVAKIDIFMVHSVVEPKRDMRKNMLEAQSKRAPLPIGL